MRHPFDGLNGIPPDRHPIDGGETENAALASRRSFFKRTLAAGAGLLAVVVGGRASAQLSTQPRGGQVTTPALGEEGGGRHAGPSPGRGRVTTYALGEESGRPGGGWSRPPQSHPPRYTTYATGEEGGRYTTYAVGEEGGRYTTYALGEEGGRYTTYALGEEGGGY
jgi:hypothetical protein